MPGVPYNKKNMQDASDYYKPSAGQQEFEEGVKKTWNTLKGLVGAGDEDTKDKAMGEAIKRRKKAYGE